MHKHLKHTNAKPGVLAPEQQPGKVIWINKTFFFFLIRENSLLIC